MIGKLRGIIDTVHDDSLILDVQGVGYHIYASGKTLSLLPATAHEVTLLIDTHVREDHIHLYGFASAHERQWFRTLTTVQGVGVKMALAILGQFTPEQLITLIGAQDKKSLTSVSGVGPKLAERIVTELKNIVAKWPNSASATVASAPVASTAASAGTAIPHSLQDDAVSALSHLGYSRMEAFSAVARVLQRSPDATLDILITTALRELAA